MDNIAKTNTHYDGFKLSSSRAMPSIRNEFIEEVDDYMMAVKIYPNGDLSNKPALWYVKRDNVYAYRGSSHSVVVIEDRTEPIVLKSRDSKGRTVDIPTTYEEIRRCMMLLKKANRVAKK